MPIQIPYHPHRAAAEAYARMRFSTLWDIRQLDTTLTAVTLNAGRDFARASNAHLAQFLVSDPHNGFGHWELCYRLACRYAVGYQSPDGDREDDAIRGLRCLCLHKINVAWPRNAQEPNLAWDYIHHSGVSPEFVVQAQSTASAIYMQLYLLPLADRPQAVKAYSFPFSRLAAHVIGYLIEAVVYAAHALICGPLVSIAVVNAGLALRELDAEMQKLGRSLDHRQDWLESLNNVADWWIDHAPEPQSPLVLVGSLVPDCLFEQCGSQRFLRQEVCSIAIDGLTEARARWKEGARMGRQRDAQLGRAGFAIRSAHVSINQNQAA